MQVVTFMIEGLHCEGCAERLGIVLQRHQGVREADVSFASGEARVQFYPHVTSRNHLFSAVEGAGFRVAGSA